MKKISSLILSIVCLMSAATFAACKDGGDNSSSVNTQESCEHSFADKSFACTDRVCLICGEKVKASSNHTYKAVANIAPTCIENGYTLNKCECGATMKNNTVKALSHNFGEYIETVAPSCHSVGVKTAECSRCEETDNTYEAALPHQLTLVEQVAETCTENGYEKYHCSICNEDLYQNYVRATGHTSDVVSEKTVQANCEQDGYEEYKCSVCSETYYENITPALGHSWTESGCTRCGMDSKALWLTEKEGYDGVVQYTNGKGWKVSTDNNDNYAFALSKDEIAKQMVNGAKKITLVFGGAFDGVDYGTGNPVNCKINVVPKNVKGEDVWDYAAKFISQFIDNGDGTYSVEINLTNESYLFTEGVFFYVTNLDVGGVAIGACYIHDIIFS